MTRILLTGAGGQVGKVLAKKIADLPNYEMLALDRSDLDISDEIAVQKAVGDFVPDAIINAAAYTAVDKAQSEPDKADAINHLGAKYLAMSAQAVSAMMLHISTDYVFDGQKNMPYVETDVTIPQSIYGQSKLDGERAVLKACDRAIVLRTAWVFGEYGHNFVKTMLRLGKDKDTLGIVSDQFGSPTYAGDIADTLISMMDQALQKERAGVSVPYGIYHFSGMPYVSWYEFAVAIFKVAQNKGVLNKIPTLNAITTADYPTPAKRPHNSRLDMTKIQREFGIIPSDWQKALQNIADYQS